MRTDVLQAAALCCHGNAFLSDRDADRAPELSGTNSTFRAIHEVVFSHRASKLPIADPDQESTAAWFNKLKQEGVERIVLTLDQCSLDPSKQADDKWGLITDGGRGCEIWESTWKRRTVGDSTDATPWRVLYASERFNLWSLKASSNVDEAKTKLASATVMARDFLFSQNVKNLAAPLDRSVSLQAQGNEEMIGFPDLCPVSFSKEAKVLLAASLRVILIMNSTLWTSQTLSPEATALFRVNSLRLWHGACLALETAAITGQIEAVRPSHLGSTRLEAS